MDIPAELAERKQWVVWRNEAGRKIPYQPTGSKAKSNDPETWSTLAECQTVASQYSGLGFVFAADDPFCGVDLDHVYNDGEIANWAADVLAELPTYAEISPSGRGIKLWLRAKLPDGRGRKLPIADRLVGFLAPRWLRIAGYWYPRGGMPIDVFWQSGRPPAGLWIPDTGVAPYRGRG